MAVPAVTTAALLSAPLVVLLFLFGHMATSAPTDSCLDGCVCFQDFQKRDTINCTSFKPVWAASALLSDFSHVEILNVQDIADDSNDYIIDGLFQAFPNIKYMNLINASISKVYPGAFKGLKRLEELDMSKNKIHKVNREALSETPKLRYLDLSENPLRLSPNTFLVSRSLEDLILASCNLTSVPSGSFKGLPNLRYLDLYDNHIQTFTYRSFPRSLRHLFLTKNNLTNIFTKAISSLNKLTTLDISENPINCTCSLIGLQDWFSSRGILFENDVICAYPPEYEGKSWRLVFENEVCVDNDDLIVTKKTEENSIHSCENEMCDENKIEDRFLYNEVQADQPAETATKDFAKTDDEQKEDTAVITSTNENKVTENTDPNKIENLTENKPQSAEKVLELTSHETEKPEQEEFLSDELNTTIDEIPSSQETPTNNVISDSTKSADEENITLSETPAQDNVEIPKDPVEPNVITTETPDLTTENNKEIKIVHDEKTNVVLDEVQPTEIPEQTTEKKENAPQDSIEKVSVTQIDIQPTEIPEKTTQMSEAITFDSKEILNMTPGDIQPAELPETTTQKNVESRDDSGEKLSSTTIDSDINDVKTVIEYTTATPTTTSEKNDSSVETTVTYKTVIQPSGDLITEELKTTTPETVTESEKTNVATSTQVETNINPTQETEKSTYETTTCFDCNPTGIPPTTVLPSSKEVTESVTVHEDKTTTVTESAVKHEESATSPYPDRLETTTHVPLTTLVEIEKASVSTESFQVSTTYTPPSSTSVDSQEHLDKTTTSSSGTTTLSTPSSTINSFPEISTPVNEIDNSSVSPSTESTTTITTSTTPELINVVPTSKEIVPDTTTQAIVPDKTKSESKNGTNPIFTLPSTDENGKSEKVQESSEQKSEPVGSYIVLAGIMIVLLLLILYASTRRSKKSNKKCVDDAEGNMTELQDMKSLLPNSPVTNGHKNEKYPNEEPSVTAKLLDSDDHPDSNGNGYMFPKDSQAEPKQNNTTEIVQEPNGKATLSRTNGTSNGPPPLELTKAKVIILPDSLPRTPIYIQKNVDS